MWKIRWNRGYPPHLSTTWVANHSNTANTGNFPRPFYQLAATGLHSTDCIIKIINVNVCYPTVWFAITFVVIQCEYPANWFTR